MSVGYFRKVWNGIRTTAKGLRVTWQHFLTKPTTIQYPEERPYFSPYERGLHEFEPEKCIICELCAKACPVDCIYIEQEGRGKTARLTRYAIDYSKCLFCSLCVDPCPVDCIHMGQDYDLTSFTRDDAVIVDYTRGEGPWRTVRTSADPKTGLKGHVRD
jgi:NADH-quinone oxidoreductase subunit I